MTPQERKLVDELFERLASLEDAPRDADAVNAINRGLARAPNALYPMVQTVLVQDEALRRADARIRELESELGLASQPPGEPAGFLDGMRDALFGRRESQGSVPTVRPAAPAGGWSQTAMPPPVINPTPAAQAAGGSFLGTAAAAAAGVIGGTLLVNSMRGLFGSSSQAQPQSALDAGGAASPWGAGGSDLAREAGLGDIGRGGQVASEGGGAQRSGQFDLAHNDAEDFRTDDDFDDGFDLGDIDTA